jgi:hypothetical protein
MLIEHEDGNNGYLGSKNVKGWIIYQHSTIKNEGCRNHPN